MVVIAARAAAGALVVLTAVVPVGCRKSSPPSAPAVEAAGLPPLDVTRDGAWLFTYADANGAFVTVDKLDSVPEGARRLVRVIDPGKSATERRDTSSVYVADLGELARAGKQRARIMTREAFETGALAQLPPGESSLLAAGPPPGSEPAAVDAGAAAPGAAPAAVGAPVVTLYGTSWCGACRAARQYLMAKKIPFVDKDVEKDPAAARELAGKAARLGVPADRVPILEVRGRLLIGFDRARLEALLGEAT